MARPDPGLMATEAVYSFASMEGRAMARPDPQSLAKLSPTAIQLQWRAEQWLGQTAPHIHLARRGLPASMEGRAMARPDAANPSSTSSATPELQWRAEQWLGQTCPSRQPGGHARSCFNGGPSNGSARPCAEQTGPRRVVPASMEGRAMARPDPVGAVLPAGTSVSLQWRAEQWLGQTADAADKIVDAFMLQWRAEQWLGQTWPPGSPAVRDLIASMEGRAMARPDVFGRTEAAEAAFRASMEGRAMARPDVFGRTEAAEAAFRASMEGRAMARPDCRRR